MKQFSILKLISLLLVAAINLAGFLPLQSSRAYFSDVEHSAGNAFIADPLHISVDAGDGRFLPAVSESQASGLPAMITSDSPRDFDLSIMVENPNGGLCPSLELTAAAGSNNSGALALPSFGYQAGAFSAAGNIWYFTANLVTGAVQSGLCDFDLVFQGEQLGGGYSYRNVVKAHVVASAPLLSESEADGEGDEIERLIAKIKTKESKEGKEGDGNLLTDELIDSQGGDLKNVDIVGKVEMQIETLKPEEGTDIELPLVVPTDEVTPVQPALQIVQPDPSVETTEPSQPLALPAEVVIAPPAAPDATQ